MRTRIPRMRFAAAAVLLLCAIGMQTHAATITVTTTNDSGPGSLRQALTIANDGDTVTFAVTGRIILISGGLVIDKNVTISGPGADQLAIDGNHAESQCVFDVATYDGTVMISGLTITNGDCGIGSSFNTLRVSNCVVRGNHSYGGLYNGGYLTIADSIISDNSGTGVSNYGYQLTILNSTLSGNSVGQDYAGGGIGSGTFKRPASVEVVNSTISGNSAGSGGGIASLGPLSIVNSTISGNVATGGVAQPGHGGGIVADFVSIMNSTISGNSAGGRGGGIYTYTGQVHIANSTFSGNSAPSGGGIYNSAVLEAGNTIFNAGASGENIFNNGGTVTSRGYNICSDNGGGYLNGPGDQINTDPLLGPLQDNGGPTLTHMPLAGSPAIDAGNPNFTPPPFRDQRGRCFYRVFGRRIDVGSVEIQPGPRCPTPAPRPTPPPRPIPR